MPQLTSCLTPPARRVGVQDQTFPVLHCPTSPPAAPTKPKLTLPPASLPHWQLILMRTSSDISKDGLQRTLRNRYSSLVFYAFPSVYMAIQHRREATNLVLHPPPRILFKLYKWENLICRRKSSVRKLFTVKIEASIVVDSFYSRFVEFCIDL